MTPLPLFSKRDVDCGSGGGGDAADDVAEEGV